MKKNLIAIQDEYVETINAGMARWSTGGHMSRIARGARHKAERRLRGWGFNKGQIEQVIRDAHDMAALIRNSEE